MANEVIKGCGFCHIALGAVDFEKSVAFYKALGMTVYHSWGEAPHRVVMFNLGDGGNIELFEGAPDVAENMPKWQHLAIATTDLQGAFDAAVAAGAVVKSEPTACEIHTNEGIYMVSIAFVYGPSGEVIEFFCED